MSGGPQFRDARAADGERGREADADVRVLFGESMALFASLAGPAHVIESANEAFFAAIGGPERHRTGVPLADVLPELREQGFLTLLNRVLRTGVGHHDRDVRVTLGTGEKAREAYFDYSCEPRVGAGGLITGVHVIGVETTQVKQAQRLMAEHRALLEQIARQAPLATVLDGMARAIEALAPDELLVSVLLADPDGRHLRHGAAPTLPAFYNQAIDGIATGEGVGSCGTAAHRRETVIVTDIETDPFWVEFRDLARRAGLAACWSTPIMSRDAELLGTFAMYHRRPRAPQETDVALSTMFVETAALAIERHRGEQARAAAEARAEVARADLAFLLETSTAITADLDFTQCLQRLADACFRGLAPLCAVDVVQDGRVQRIATAAPTEEQSKLLGSHIPVYEAHDDAVARVLARGVTEVARREPAGPGPWRQLGVTGYVCVPLLDRGEAFGAVTLLSVGDRAFDGHSVTLAEELARRTASAALNARQYTHRVGLSRDLQAGLLLSEVPAIPGTQIATHYRPAGEGLEVGGDFYDVFHLDGDRWALLLGDVCGRGALAASTTALVRNTARAVAPLLPEPLAVVRAVNRALIERPASHGDGFVTLLYAEFTPAADGLDINLVRAGHPHPVHLDSQGARLVKTPGSLLGILKTPGLSEHRLHLRPGESLVLYTDGITETRNLEGELFGEQALATHLAGLTRPATAEKVLEHLIDGVNRFGGAVATDDDQAVMVVTARLSDQDVAEDGIACGGCSRNSLR